VTMNPIPTLERHPRVGAWALCGQACPACAARASRTEYHPQG
jgi:hypothetical protein